MGLVRARYNGHNFKTWYTTPDLKESGELQ